MIKIHVLDLLYKLWYRGCFYKNRKVRRFLLDDGKRPRTKWEDKVGTPVESNIVIIWIMQFAIMPVILFVKYCGWSAGVVCCIGLVMVIAMGAMTFTLGFLWKDKNWYFNEEKLKELNKGLVDENLIWPIRVLNFLLYIVFGFFVLFLPIILYIGILFLAH